MSPRQFVSAVAFLLSLASLDRAAAAPGEPGFLGIGFLCHVADGPRLTDCAPLGTELAPAKVDVLRRRVEATPSCQLAGLSPGSSVQRTEYFRDTPELLSPEALAAPHMSEPDWLRRPSPERLTEIYPERAAREGIEGRAVINCEVDLSGRARNCRVESEAPENAGFGQAALLAAEDFRFRPMMRDCEPVADGPVRIPLDFVLPGGSSAAPDEPSVAPEAPPPWRPRLGRDALLDVSACIGGLLLAVVGLTSLLRHRSGTASVPGAPMIVEIPSRPPLLGLLAPVGLALALWAGWRLLPQALAAGRDIAGRGLDLGVPRWGLVAAYLVVAGSLSAVESRRAALVAETRPKPRGLFWTGRGLPIAMLYWIWTAEHLTYEDRWLSSLVWIARAVAAVGLLVLSLVLVDLAL